MIKEKNFKVLIIEDHPTIIEIYRLVLDRVEKNSQEYYFIVDVVNDCDQAINKINEAVKYGGFDMVFLDIQLPPSIDNLILSGEDLGIKIRKLLPKAKILIITFLTDNFRLHSLFNNINPEGLFLKTDITSTILVEGVEKIINDIPYYSDSIIKLMRYEVSNDMYLDKIDRQILYELANGTKMSEMSDFIPKSLGSIERRKKVLKETFGVSKESDSRLIRVAREMGFI